MLAPVQKSRSLVATFNFDDLGLRRRTWGQKMKGYRSVSWKRNLLVIPPELLEKIHQIDGDLFHVVTCP